MPRHFSQVFVDSDGDRCIVTIRCQHCEGGTFTIAAAHLETLARVLPRVAKSQGIDLDDRKTETRIFQADTPEARAEADRMFDAFVAMREKRETKG